MTTGYPVDTVAVVTYNMAGIYRRVGLRGTVVVDGETIECWRFADGQSLAQRGLERVLDVTVLWEPAALEVAQ